MRIGNVDTRTHVALVAEIGNNHEGSVGLAQELIGLAHQSGADAIKLQTLIPELFVSKRDLDRMEVMRRFALSLDETQQLIVESAKSGIHVFSTPLDLVSAQSLAEVATTFKVSSGDLTFTGLIDLVSSYGKDVILSTGASYMSEVESAVDRVTSMWGSIGAQPELALLHCVSVYPSSPSSANLRSIHELKSRFPRFSIGFSDHSIGIDVAVAAVAAGSTIIEKHFTLDKNYSDFRDHSLSADPPELRELKSRIEELVDVLGSGEKVPDPTEMQNRSLIRRSVSAAIDLPIGHLIRREDLLCLRPGSGIPAERFESIIGRTTIRDFGAGDPLEDSGLS